ncbi:MAG: pyridoxamine 5'-phosphate oxidase family protein [Nitrospirae bacterium]|nr:pyridoxamine 5'-phosphate oxidase family protein [Nitrospirota bacterium]MDA1304377.1 pyridoxamine 5'-phosphate oxidase family protein [Nitrospirota bacterium]
MKQPISDIAFTPAVKAIQKRMGSRRQDERMEDRGGWTDTITQDLSDFIAERDSFYLATATADGQPYIQHRGGPKGFLKVLDDHTLAFADFVGNRQYITAGNLAENNKAFIFLMDYANQQRIKVWGTAEVVENDPKLLDELNDANYKGKPERIIRFYVKAWDVNCPQHITPRVDEETEGIIQNLKLRVAELEAENIDLKSNYHSQAQRHSTNS